jgi:GTP pyrophosphokinase
MPKTIERSSSVPNVWARLRAALDRYLRDPKGRSLVARAYRAARASHRGQVRASGDEYIVHPLEVACILAELRLAPAAIAAALLHDVLEDSALDRRRLDADFGPEVAELVDGVTKLSAVELPRTAGPRQDSHAVHQQAENLRKLFLAMARDIRVIFIRLADRLHNMRTVSHLPPERREAMARETMEVYAALAGRLGLWEFRWRLEDLAFAELQPDACRELEKLMAERLKRRRRTLAIVRRGIERCLREEGLEPFSVEGRTKHLYSIQAKMKRKGCGLDEMLDLLAVRVIVPEVADCYRAFGLIQNLWMPIPGRFKDHIAMPKPNGYRSLHTTVLGPDGFPVEVQIRTPEMHRVNELGVAAHWAYKEGLPARGGDREREAYAWVRRLLEWIEEGRGEPDYLQSLKMDILSHQVFVFTPRGDVVDLPSGSTPLDFAYRIHTQVGHRFIGARVNSRIAPIDYRLRNADIVDVLTSNRDNPSWDWLKVVKSRHARSKIRQWFRRERRPESVQRGRDLLQAEMERKGIRLSLKQEDLLEPLWSRSHNSLEDLLASIGSGETDASLMAKKLLKLLPPEYVPPKRTRAKPPRLEKSPPVPVIIPGLTGINLRLAKCCLPVKGQDIVGYVSQGRVTVHRKDCSNFRRLSENKDRLTKARWI